MAEEDWLEEKKTKDGRERLEGTRREEEGNKQEAAATKRQ